MYVCQSFFSTVSWSSLDDNCAASARQAPIEVLAPIEMLAPIEVFALAVKSITLILQKNFPRFTLQEQTCREGRSVLRRSNRV